MKSSELHRMIRKHGWVHIRTSGSHYIYEKGIRTYPVPYHGAAEMGKGIANKIIKEMGLNNKSMKTIRIIIERSKDIYNAFAENVAGVYGGGATIDEAKHSIIEAITLTKKHNKPESIPAILNGEYKFEYKFDTESFLKYYKGILTNSAISRISGINPTLIQHYASGLKKPRKQQIEKLEKALHAFGQELIEVRL